MRLSPFQIEQIKTIVSSHAGSASRTYVYGSRLDDSARGGDVDLLIETGQPLPRLEQARLKAALESALGLPVDIIVRHGHELASHFESMIQARAEALDQINPGVPWLMTSAGILQIF